MTDRRLSEWEVNWAVKHLVEHGGCERLPLLSGDDVLAVRTARAWERAVAAFDSYIWPVAPRIVVDGDDTSLVTWYALYSKDDTHQKLILACPIDIATQYHIYHYTVDREGVR